MVDVGIDNINYLLSGVDMSIDYLLSGVDVSIDKLPAIRGRFGL